ncbi:hypothetical protein DFJ77DRAFT_440903 [Powellomyces hirtus]|nr:hypothetical protein DFJ77DRAFT_440903 [Powellomyces hirtus]
MPCSATGSQVSVPVPYARHIQRGATLSAPKPFWNDIQSDEQKRFLISGVRTTRDCNYRLPRRPQAGACCDHTRVHRVTPCLRRPISSVTGCFTISSARPLVVPPRFCEPSNGENNVVTSVDSLIMRYALQDNGLDKLVYNVTWDLIQELLEALSAAKRTAAVAYIAGYMRRPQSLQICVTTFIHWVVTEVYFGDSVLLPHCEIDSAYANAAKDSHGGAQSGSCSNANMDVNQCTLTVSPFLTATSKRPRIIATSLMCTLASTAPEWTGIIVSKLEFDEEEGFNGDDEFPKRTKKNQLKSGQ